MIVGRVPYIVVPPVDRVQLVQITAISRTYGRYIELVDGGYKPTNITGGLTLYHHNIIIYHDNDHIS